MRRRGKKKEKERRGKLSGMHMVCNSVFMKFSRRLKLFKLKQVYTEITKVSWGMFKETRQNIALIIVIVVLLS